MPSCTVYKYRRANSTHLGAKHAKMYNRTLILSLSKAKFHVMIDQSFAKSCMKSNVKKIVPLPSLILMIVGEKGEKGEGAG